MTTTTNGRQLIFRQGELAHDDYALDMTAEQAGWAYCGLRVIEHRGHASTTLHTGADELLVLPLQGGCQVAVDGQQFSLHGRTGVFAEVTDYLYVPRDAELTITSDGGRFALPSARASRKLTPSYWPADQVRVGLRGTGNCSRQVNNYALGNDLQTDHLLACEVLTPGGNWSSYPPHKHDEFTEVERELEEIYYFEIRNEAAPHPGFAFHATYGEPGRPIEVCAMVYDGDLALVPHGYHGPCAAAPGYDLYYLNVMAGPAEDRRWLMTDDPAYHWIRDTWEHQDVDPRLPMTGPATKEVR